MTLKYLQDWGAIVSILLDLGIPSGRGEGRRIAPRVVIESEEVATSIGAAAVHVCGHLVSVVLDISCRVAHRNGTVATGADVGLDVTSDRLNEWGSEDSLVVVDDLVSAIKKECVVISGECIDGRENGLEVDFVVRAVDGRVVCSVEGVEWSVDVDGKVDSGVGQQFHAGIVLCRVVN